MKKYLIPVAAMLLTAGIASAQSTAKQPAKDVAKTSTTKKSSPAATKVSTPAEESKSSTGSTAVSHKHHTKKNKPAKKTEGK